MLVGWNNHINNIDYHADTDKHNNDNYKKTIKRSISKQLSSLVKMFLEIKFRIQNFVYMLLTDPCF